MAQRVVVVGTCTWNHRYTHDAVAELQLLLERMPACTVVCTNAKGGVSTIIRLATRRLRYTPQFETHKCDYLLDSRGKCSMTVYENMISTIPDVFVAFLDEASDADFKDMDLFTEKVKALDSPRGRIDVRLYYARESTRSL